MKISKVDSLIERLEILADNNYYPLEENKEYNALCRFISHKGINDEVDDDDIMAYYRLILKSIKSYC